MRNSSQNAGCILRLPASHSCHPRNVQCMSAAAAVCDSPEASRAARTSFGEGLAAGPFGPRFGWLGIVFDEHEMPGLNFLQPCSRDFSGLIRSLLIAADLLCLAIHRVAGSRQRANKNDFVQFGLDFDGAKAGDFDCRLCGHFLLLPLFLPRRGGLRCASLELNNTRIACKCKNFLQKTSEAMA